MVIECYRFFIIDIPALARRLAIRRGVIPEHVMNPMLSIPTEADWGDYRSDLDQEDAHGKCAGKSKDEMQQFFAKYQSKRLGT
jgi:hypothetical protein